MKAAARMAGRVTKLVLLETNPFYLLAQAGQVDAFTEAMDLRNCVKKFGARRQWATAAERFADYWGGAGSWRDMPSERRVTFAEALKPNFFEWDAVMNETTSAERWAAAAAGSHAAGERSRHGFAHSRDYRNSASIVSSLGLHGGAGRRSHGAAHSPGRDQSARGLIPEHVKNLKQSCCRD